MYTERGRYLGSARNGVWRTSGGLERACNEAVLSRGRGPGIHVSSQKYSIITMPDAMYFSNNNRAASICFVFYSTVVSSMRRVWCLEIFLFWCNKKQRLLVPILRNYSHQVDTHCTCNPTIYSTVQHRSKNLRKLLIIAIVRLTPIYTAGNPLLLGENYLEFAWGDFVVTLKGLST